MKILKKIRERIVSSPKRHEKCYSVAKHLAPITFNTSVHGENIKISTDGLLAKRNQSFCKAIVFSSRALLINEEINIVITSVSSAWNGSLRFGFCITNPINFKNKLPRYMCPNLTNIQGCYARALKDGEAKIGTILTFWLNEFGQIMYKINGVTQGVFLQIDYYDINIPMWAMIDVYGLVTSVKIENTKNLVINKSRASRSYTELNNVSMQLNDLNINEPVYSSHPHQIHPLNLQQMYATISSRDFTSKFYSNVQFTPLQFHETIGANVKLNSNRTIASRKSMSSNLGYVFTKRPLKLNEKLVIHILKTDTMCNGNLGFGLTTCNPADLNQSDLPNDSHKFLDRNEYWVVIKDLLANAKAGDELGFVINHLNQVQLSKNNLPPVTLMHVDATQNFYAFFDLYGKTVKISLLGTFIESSTLASMNSVQFANFNFSQNNLVNFYSEINNDRHVQLQQNQQSSQQQLKILMPENNLKNSPSSKLNKCNLNKINSSNCDKTKSEQFSSNGECTVCFEKQINCVLYQCGHMCMCYDCAMRQWQGIGGGQCPICRAYICDVIRTYWS